MLRGTVRGRARAAAILERSARIGPGRGLRSRDRGGKISDRRTRGLLCVLPSVVGVVTAADDGPLEASKGEERGGPIAGDGRAGTRFRKEVVHEL